MYKPQKISLLKLEKSACSRLESVHAKELYRNTIETLKVIKKRIFHRHTLIPGSYTNIIIVCEW